MARVISQKMARTARFSLLFSLLWLAGCAQFATVKPTQPKLAITGSPQPALLASESQLKSAARLEKTDPARALGSYLASAETALDRLDHQPADRQARDLYNFSVARAIGVIEEAKLDPWDRPLTVPGPEGNYTLTTIKHPGPDRDPAAYDIIPSDSLVTGGTYVTERVTLLGVGAPVVAIGRQPNRSANKTFSMRRIYAGPTAIIRFQGRKAKLEFMEPFATEHVVLDGHDYPLAADFTAPVVVALTREKPADLGLIRMLRPEKYADTARLTRLQPYDANRIPVIFVHGLQDTPASWTPMINALWADPVIRRRDQLWVYSYPSGYPFFYSAALFRQALDDVARAFPNRKRVVLVGHSMGGMICHLMIIDPGEKIWLDAFGKPPSETNLPAETKRLAEESLIFHRRPEVARVVFMSTPHRGSDLAINWIGRIATNLIKMPFFVASIPTKVLSSALVPTEGTTPLKRVPNSIDTLSPTNRFVREMNKFPISPERPLSLDHRRSWAGRYAE